MCMLEAWFRVQKTRGGQEGTSRSSKKQKVAVRSEVQMKSLSVVSVDVGKTPLGKQPRKKCDHKGSGGSAQGSDDDIFGSDMNVKTDPEQMSHR